MEKLTGKRLQTSVTIKAIHALEVIDKYYVKKEAKEHLFELCGSLNVIASSLLIKDYEDRLPKKTNKKEGKK